ncbi:spore photoproduct lyase family protein, partial [Bacillus mycoides]
MNPFIPNLLYFQPKPLHYPLPKELYQKFSKIHLQIPHTTSHNQ